MIGSYTYRTSNGFFRPLYDFEIIKLYDAAVEKLVVCPTLLFNNRGYIGPEQLRGLAEAILLRAALSVEQRRKHER